MFKKLLISITIFSMLLALTATAFLWPQNVEAQSPAVSGGVRGGSPQTELVGAISSTATPGMPTADIGSRLMTILKTVWETIKIYGENAAALTYTNGIKYLFNRVAYDYATKLATGGKGQQPLYVDLPFDKYLQKVGDEALGVAFVEIGKTWGVNFCQPIDRPFLKAQLDIYARAVFEPQRPPCDWVDIKKNVGDLRKIQFNDLFGVSTAFHPGANDFGIYLTMVDQISQKRILQEETAKINQAAKDGFKDLESTITGKIKTPAVVYSGYAAGMISDSLKPYGVYTGKAAADAIGLFTNTLVSKLLARAFTKGMNPSADRTIVLNLFGGLSSGPAATDQFAELLKPDYNVGGEINVVNELSAQCSTSEYGGAQYCNTIDTTFATAIEQKNTVAELAKKKPNAVFGFDPKAQAEPSFRDGFPMRSILILRKYRIVPVGWELAAEYIKNFNKDDMGVGVRVTLQDLLDAYNNPESPFYKLVDPNWQLKAPMTVCDLEGPGPEIVSPPQEVCDRDTSGDGKIVCGPDEPSIYIVRNTYCAKERSCIAESDNGKDCNEFGYCVAEKPIWRIQGDSCPSYFNSCQSLSATGLEEAAYLANTLESCGAAGCNAYCKNLDPTSDTWLCPAETNLSYYASEQACDAKDEGCQALTRILNPNQTPLSQQQASVLVSSGNFNSPGVAGYLATDINLKLAPEYANPTINSCAGYTTAVNATSQTACVAGSHYWREDIKQCVLSGNKYCANFSLACAEDDVSCRLYTPVTIKSPAVPAVIDQRLCSDGTNSCADADVPTGNWNDECPAECVGFRTYTQKETNFEAGVAAESFLSTTATKCTEAGCDEFTNLDEVARGGEGREYFSYLRLCVNPTDPDVQTFYTWEGSDTAGFQLKKWQLQATGNTPVGTTCAMGTAGVDCREVYNPTANQYYAVDFATVIFASEDCHPYRRTIANQNDCETHGGSWTAGQCLYMAMPSLSTRCQASNASCRLYRDNSSYNYQVILSDDFEANTITGWTAGAISNESVRRDGHSLHLVDSTEHKLNSGDLVAGSSYVLSFLAKGTATFDFSLVSGTNVISGTVSGTITNEWQLFDGQAAVNFGELPAGDYADPILRIENMGDLYLDNLVLKKIDNILFIKNSWTAAPVCDNIVGMSSCEAYKDNMSKVWNLQKFSKLCLEEVVGCEVFGQKDADGDLQPVYYVYDRNKICQNPGCTKLGLLTRDRFDPTDSTRFGFKDILMIVKQNQTCSSENEACVNYTYTNGGGAALYKNPGKRVCEFKDYNGQFGWWIAGEEGKPCPSSNSYCYNNTSISCTTNANCTTGTGDFCVTTNGYCYGETNRTCTTDANCRTGDFCVISQEVSSEQKYCLGGRSIIHPDSNICNGNSDCVDYLTFAQNGICTSWSALCDGGESGCQEYQDPYVPELCDATLLPYQYSSLYTVYGAGQTPACEYYWYKKVESVGNETDTACDPENIDPTKHCFLRTGER